MIYYILGIIGGAIAVYFKRRYDIGSALMENLSVLQNILKKDKTIQSNDVKIESLKANIPLQPKKETLSNEELAKIFNDIDGK